MTDLEFLRNFIPADARGTFQGSFGRLRPKVETDSEAAKLALTALLMLPLKSALVIIKRYLTGALKEQADSFAYAVADSTAEKILGRKFRNWDDAMAEMRNFGGFMADLKKKQELAGQNAAPRPEPVQ